MYLRVLTPVTRVDNCAAGVRLDGFLAESEGLFGDLHLRHFARHYQVSSVKSGSGQPPDRVQISSCDDEAGLKLFFSDPVSGPPNWNFKRRNAKKNVRKSDMQRTCPSDCAKHGPGSNYSPVETAFRKRVVVVADIRK